jgi:chromosome segregation ATPase
MGVEEIHHYTGISKEELYTLKNYYENRLSNMEERHKTDEKTITDLNKKIENIKDKMKQYEEDLKIKDLESINGKYKYEEVKEQYYKALDMLKECQEQRDNALKNLKNISKKLKEAESLADEFKSKWESEKKKYEEEKKKSGELEIKNKLKDKIIDYLKIQKEKFETDNKRLIQINETLKNNFKTLTLNYNALNDNYNNLKDEMDEMKGNLEEIKDQNEETNEKLKENEKNMNAIKKQNEEQKRKISELSKQNEEILNNQYAMSQQMAQLIKALGNLNNKNDKNDCRPNILKK